MRLWTFCNLSRPQVHLAITRDTFREAGWSIAEPKVQLDFSLELLGLGISSQGEGEVFVPEAKRRGMRVDIAAQQQTRRSDGTVERGDVETLVGRASHIAQAAGEANAFLAPMYVMQEAKRKVKTAAGQTIRVKPRRLAVRGPSATQLEYQRSLAWWDAALEAGISAPLAPRLVFPHIGDEGCGFMFTDAARGSGTGHGAFSFIRSTMDTAVPPICFHLERQWDDLVQRALIENRFSMPAGECFGAVIFADALTTATPGLTHMVVFTDSVATAQALTTGSSSAPQINYLVQWLQQRHPSVQWLGIHQPGKRNCAADGLSRDGTDTVLAEVTASGAVTVELTAAQAAWRALEHAMSLPLRGADAPTASQVSKTIAT